MGHNHVYFNQFNFCMKKITTILTLLVAAQSIIFAQTTAAPPIEWTSVIKLTSTLNDEIIEPADFCADAEGNTYALVVALEDIALPNNEVIVVPENEFGVVLFKHNKEGLLLYAKPLSFFENISDNLSIARIAADQSGNVYVAGSYATNTELPLENLACDCEAIYLAKLDSEGDMIWGRNITGDPSSSSAPIGLGCDPEGNVLLVATTTGLTLTMDSSTYDADLQNSQFLIKYDADGQDWYTQTLPDGNLAQPSHLGMGDDGSFFVAGFQMSELNFGNNVTLSDFEIGQNPYYLVRYNKELQPVWATSIYSSESYTDLLDLEFAANGKLYVGLDKSGGLIVDGQEVLSTTLSEFSSALVVFENNQVIYAEQVPYNEDSYIFWGLASNGNNFFGGGYLFEEEVVVGNNTLMPIECADLVLTTGNTTDGLQGFNLGGPGCEGVANIFYGNSIDTDADGNLYMLGLFVDGGTVGSTSFDGSGMFVTKLQTGTSSTDQVNAQPPVKLVPNPNNGTFSLDLGAVPQSGTLEITDLLGRVLHTQHGLQTQQVQVRLDLADGLYQVRMQDGDRQMVARMQVVR